MSHTTSETLPGNYCSFDIHTELSGNEMRGGCWIFSWVKILRDVEKKEIILHGPVGVLSNDQPEHSVF